MPINELLEIMASLRGPNGCPWDKKQTRKSLNPFLVEEAYEVNEAVEGGDPEKIKEELGDLLFQVVFHCQIAKEKNEFDFFDVVKAISHKMVQRHPHVFGDASLNTSEEVLVHWEKQKKKEARQPKSLVDSVPITLPALLMAHRIQDKVSRVGFDWKSPEGVIEKMDEELQEFKTALSTQNIDQIEEEFGDILFSLVNLSRFHHVNPEEALRKSIAKFKERFKYIEKRAEKSGKPLSEMSLQEMDALWDEYKATSKG